MTTVYHSIKQHNYIHSFNRLKGQILTVMNKTYSRSSDNVNRCSWIAIWLMKASIANLPTKCR